MVKITTLLEEGKLSRIPELERERYENFFSASSKDNLEHSKAVISTFPRWSIISGYYAMHDSAKLLLAKSFRLKVEYEVHATTIKALHDVIKGKDLPVLLEKGYKEFIFLANDLSQAKEERVKTQYYTGSPYMKEQYKHRAKEFLANIVEPFLDKIKRLMEQ